MLSTKCARSPLKYLVGHLKDDHFKTLAIVPVTHVQTNRHLKKSLLKYIHFIFQSRRQSIYIFPWLYTIILILIGIKIMDIIFQTSMLCVLVGSLLEVLSVTPLAMDKSVMTESWALLQCSKILEKILERKMKYLFPISGVSISCLILEIK